MGNLGETGAPDWKAFVDFVFSWQHWGQSTPIAALFENTANPRTALFTLLLWYAGLFVAAAAYRFLAYSVLRGSRVVGYSPQIQAAELYCMRAGFLIGILCGFIVFQNIPLAVMVGVGFMVGTAGIGVEASSANRASREQQAQNVAR